MWHRLGVVYNPGGHVQMPIVLDMGDKLRVYYSARFESNLSYGAFVDLDACSMEVIKEHRDPIIWPQAPGRFDDAGAMPSCVITLNSITYLYYIGWNRCVDVPFRQAIGMAESVDGGETFRQPKGPILDRSWIDPYSVSMPFILRDDGGRWRMWYCSYRGWKGKESRYDIRYAQAPGAVSWSAWDARCLSYRWSTGRPCVLKRGDGAYDMWFCHRGLADYRTDPKTAYRIGHARSSEGLKWEMTTPDVFDGQCDGWDSIMQCYPYVYKRGCQLHMLYNGNGFGQTGIGHAVWEGEWT